MADTVPILDLLAAKYCAPHFVFLREVRNATGFDSTRSADAMALGMYRSRGRDLYGFEVKVSRSDWLRELKDPDKAESIGQFCDYFFLVIPDEPIVVESELPPTWGLIVAKAKSLKYLKQAQKIDPRPLTRAFFAAFVKQAMDSVSKPAEAEMNRLLDERWEQGKKAGESHADSRMKACAELERKVSLFEKNSGVRIDRWIGDDRLEKVGDAVRKVLAKEELGDKFLNSLRWQVQAIERIAEDARRSLTELQAPVTTGEEVEA